MWSAGLDSVTVKVIDLDDRGKIRLPLLQPAIPQQHHGDKVGAGRGEAGPPHVALEVVDAPGAEDESVHRWLRLHNYT